MLVPETNTRVTYLLTYLLTEQVGLQCEERGLLVEYMRRHYVDALQVSK